MISEPSNFFPLFHREANIENRKLKVAKDLAEQWQLYIDHEVTYTAQLLSSMRSGDSTKKKFWKQFWTERCVAFFAEDGRCFEFDFVIENDFVQKSHTIQRLPELELKEVDCNEARTCMPAYMPAVFTTMNNMFEDWYKHNTHEFQDGMYDKTREENDVHAFHDAFRFKVSVNAKDVGCKYIRITAVNPYSL